MYVDATSLGRVLKQHISKAAFQTRNQLTTHSLRNNSSPTKCFTTATILSLAPLLLTILAMFYSLVMQLVFYYYQRCMTHTSSSLFNGTLIFTVAMDEIHIVTIHIIHAIHEGHFDEKTYFYCPHTHGQIHVHVYRVADCLHSSISSHSRRQLATTALDSSSLAGIWRNSQFKLLHIILRPEVKKSFFQRFKSPRRLRHGSVRAGDLHNVKNPTLTPCCESKVLWIK